MKAWNFEAAQITIDDDPKLDDIVINDEITEFINPNKKNNKFFIVAPKGLGKTLLLKILRMRYHNAKTGVTYIPDNELCEKVSINMFSIRKEEISNFSNQNLWKDIWKITIVIAILVRLKLDIDETYRKKFKKANNISSILNIILDDYKFFLFRHKNIFSTILMPQIRDLQQQIAIFIDSFDQAIEELFKFQNFDFSNSKEKKDAFDLWANSQLGLMYAINDICQQQRHIKIFTAIREEAFCTDTSALNLQINDFVTRISYTKKELEGIFIKNIDKTDNSKLFKPADNNPFIKFLGTKNITHAIVRKKEEDIFDFIFRHTFDQFKG